MAETDQFTVLPEFLSTIDRYLASRKAMGKPMRIHLWDNGHNTSEPIQVAASPELNKLVKKYGSPLYIIEDATGKSANAAIQAHINEIPFMPRNPQDIKDKRVSAMQAIINYAKVDTLLGARNPAQILLPDQRGDEAEKLLKTMPAEDQALYKKFNEIQIKEIKDRVKAGTFTGSYQETNIDLPKLALSRLSKDEQKRFSDINQKLLPALIGNQLDTTDIDKTISGNINRVFDPKKHVQITTYGLAHFSKSKDLNENMEGLSIAIADYNNREPVSNLYFHSGKTHNQFPDYVYYPKEKRMVKMDNDEAKAEFIGMDLKQFKAWELSTQIPEQIKLPVKNSPIATTSQPIFSTAPSVPTSHISV